jgi:hypothetical protein
MAGGVQDTAGGVQATAGSLKATAAGVQAVAAVVEPTAEGAEAAPAESGGADTAATADVSSSSGRTAQPPATATLQGIPDEQR